MKNYEFALKKYNDEKPKSLRCLEFEYCINEFGCEIILIDDIARRIIFYNGKIEAINGYFLLDEIEMIKDTFKKILFIYSVDFNDKEYMREEQ